MLQDLLNDIEEIQQSVEFSRTFLKELRTYRKKLTKSIEMSKASLSTLKDKNNYVQSIVKPLVASKKEEAPDILKSEILRAVEKNREFAHHVFLNALFDVAENRGLFTIKTTGVGWSTRLIVDIEFLGYAGSLADWSKGVVETRAELNISKGPDAERASKFWREKIYLRGPYQKTMEARIKNSGRPAAFWLLLDKGTVSLASDRGGTAYPSYHRPTNFIEYTISAIKKEFNQELKTKKEAYDSNLITLKNEIDVAEQYLIKLDGLVEEISVELAKNKALYNKFSGVRNYTDRDKLDDVLVRVRRNLGVSTTSEGRVEITASGSPKRVRPTIGRLRSIVGE